ncbi:MAG: pyridoxal 5'-phosphate synthase glutaminase subunit PdxT [Candidatus Geothermincolia bacterium]
MRQRTIGVLALQGAVREHKQALERAGAIAVAVKRPEQLEGCDGLVIPGGESTAIGKLMVRYGFVEPLRRLISEGLPVFGTCAGMILLAKRVTEGEQPLLRVADITVCRNAYGRQVDSFEAALTIDGLEGGAFTGVFIRAPRIETVDDGVVPLATHQGRIVLARQGNILLAAFHPELTADGRLHSYFLKMIEDRVDPEG